jgi:hypothetical protein
MPDAIRTARDDLAFMRDLAEDRGPMPSILGAHMLAVGATFGLNVIYAWAGLRGLVPWAAEWELWSWLPATIVYIPVMLFLFTRGRDIAQTPTGRAFAAAWTGVGIMTWVIVTVLGIAASHIGPLVWSVWPALAVSLYGGAWTTVSLVRRRYWGLAVAAGCFATALGCAMLIDTPELWLVMGLGLLLFLALPGALIMSKRRPA